MSNLGEMMDKPETRQLYKSILSYMSLDKFNPTHKISQESLRDLFTKSVASEVLKEEKNISYED